MKTTSQLSPRCIAYNEETGTICGQHAYIYDRQRGGLVCAMHEPEGQHAEAIDLAIATQGYEIEQCLAHLRAAEVEKKILARAGRCLPQAIEPCLPPDSACPSSPSLTTYQMSSAEPGGASIERTESAQGGAASVEGVRAMAQTARKDAGPGHTFPGDQGGRWGRKWG